MAGSKLRLGNKVAASTLVEVLISMVVIMVIFGIAMMIFANVMASSLSVKKVKASAILNQMMQADEVAAGNSSGTFNIADFRIEQIVKSYPNESKLIEIDLTAYDSNGKEIIALDKVIISKNE